MYSLVTPSVLVVDLACRPQGPALIALVEEVLLLDRSALPVLCDALLASDAAPLIAARRTALSAEELAPTHADLADRLRDELAAAVRAVADPAAGVRGPAPAGEGIAAQLARVPVGGGLAALRRFVVDEALPAEDPQVPTIDEQGSQEAASDALVAAWAAGALDPAERAALLGPWTAGRAAAARWQVDAAQALGPQAGAVQALGAALAATPAGALGRLAGLHPSGSSWAADMHEATWAAHLSGRLRALAVAQLLAARSLLSAAGPDPDPVLVRGALTPVLGAVTAEALRDLLPGSVTASLGAVCRAVAAV